MFWIKIRKKSLPFIPLYTPVLLYKIEVQGGIHYTEMFFPICQARKLLGNNQNYKKILILPNEPAITSKYVTVSNILGPVESNVGYMYLVLTFHNFCYV